ncbi:cupin domain-containing protein [Siccirubricoccus phaeus]|uniref:cupin domain-containing protein n=1 Tax=Siccirubricoccus phaeus TaxID=2595053 RepID=UPI00165AFC6A|nr:cupin domain-containing protein [Siccirubricoccus phaeus]
MPSLAERLARRTARFAERRADWSVFGFETAKDPRFARIQRRYLGASGSTDHGDLRGSIPATAFTMSIQTVPVGNMIPKHCHETEEVFFILEGECLVRCFDGGEVAEFPLGKWDLVQLPIGMQHELVNTGAVDCQVQTLLSTPQPRRPHYEDPELLALQAQQG